MTPIWTQQEWPQGRFHISSFTIGASIYGCAAALDTQATRDATKQAASGLIDQSSGLRLIVGDFNQQHLFLDSMRQTVG